MQSNSIFHLASRMKIQILLLASLFAILHASCLPNGSINSNPLRETNETNVISPQDSIDLRRESASKDENEENVLAEELESEKKLLEEDEQDTEKENEFEDVKDEEDPEEENNEFEEVKDEEEAQVENNTEVDANDAEDDENETNDLLSVTNKIDDNGVDEFQLVTACSGELGEVIFLDDNGLEESDPMNQE